jgi:hypothetical protein
MWSIAVWHNQSVNRTACKLRLQVRFGLRPTPAGYVQRYVGLMLRNVLNKLSQAALVVGLLLVAWDYLLKPPDSIFKQIPSPDHKYIAEIEVRFEHIYYTHLHSYIVRVRSTGWTAWFDSQEVFFGRCNFFHDNFIEQYEQLKVMWTEPKKIKISCGTFSKVSLMKNNAFEFQIVYDGAIRSE